MVRSFSYYYNFCLAKNIQERGNSFLFYRLEQQRNSQRERLEQQVFLRFLSLKILSEMTSIHPHASAIRALSSELKNLKDEPLEGFRVGLLNDDNLFDWEIGIFGAPGTIYEGGYFKDPQSGELPCERWNPTQNVRTILLSVISLLNEPNTSSPANVDASIMFRRWKDSKGTDNEYEEVVKSQVAQSRAEAEKDGVVVPMTLEEYIVKPGPALTKSSIDIDLYDDDDDYDIDMGDNDTTSSLNDSQLAPSDDSQHQDEPSTTTEAKPVPGEGGENFDELQPGESHTSQIEKNENTNQNNATTSQFFYHFKLTLEYPENEVSPKAVVNFS
ncbi:unnamed protein product [Orchesella dallaii]|uniref:UBC core domain-containing protein n=1 Tax=Orchesella dallaii TaxID=48710 RepID=A0ABP1QKS9_9HEXA